MTAPLLDISVSRFIPATPEAIYDLITDLDHLTRLSAETTTATWLRCRVTAARRPRCATRWSTRRSG